MRAHGQQTLDVRPASGETRVPDRRLHACSAAGCATTGHTPLRDAGPHPNRVGTTRPWVPPWVSKQPNIPTRKALRLAVLPVDAAIRRSSSVYGTEGQEFESLRARSKKPREGAERFRPDLLGACQGLDRDRRESSDRRLSRSRADELTLTLRRPT